MRQTRQDYSSLGRPDTTNSPNINILSCIKKIGNSGSATTKIRNKKLQSIVAGSEHFLVSPLFQGRFRNMCITTQFNPETGTSFKQQFNRHDFVEV